MAERRAMQGSISISVAALALETADIPAQARKRAGVLSGRGFFTQTGYPFARKRSAARALHAPLPFNQRLFQRSVSRPTIGHRSLIILFMLCSIKAFPRPEVNRLGRKLFRTKNQIDRRKPVGTFGDYDGTFPPCRRLTR
jgi:hypothetical protein